MVQTNNASRVPFDEVTVKKYLDVCITYWRAKVKDGDEKAICYVDAYQSMRLSLFGSTLPQHEQVVIGD